MNYCFAVVVIFLIVAVVVFHFIIVVFLFVPGFVALTVFLVSCSFAYCFCCCLAVRLAAFTPNRYFFFLIFPLVISSNCLCYRKRNASASKSRNEIATLLLRFCCKQTKKKLLLTGYNFLASLFLV